MNSRLRFLAFLCVVAVLLAAASPGAGGLPQAILAPAGPILGEPVPVGLLCAAEVLSRPDLVVPRGVAARAPPLT